jgi:hypothetical protein
VAEPQTKLPPIRYKSSSKSWHDIPGLCGVFTSHKPKTICTKVATHRCKSAADAEGKSNKYGWLCKQHAAEVQNAVKINADDAPLIVEGRTCDVWKCNRRAVKWDKDGYAVCNNCSGN